MSDNPIQKRSVGLLSDYAPLIQAAQGLTLRQICAVSGLEPSTVQNWIKRGFVPRPEGKKYHERHLARILLISQLRECMQIDRIGELLIYVNGDADDLSDDIITEEELFDLFSRMKALLEEELPPPDRAGETASRVLEDYPAEPAVAEKLHGALSVMACVYMANMYKRKADSLFADL